MRADKQTIALRTKAVGTAPIVLALPRDGVPVGFAVVRASGAVAIAQKGAMPR